jgi:hypothetical protein
MKAIRFHRDIKKDEKLAMERESAKEIITCASKEYEGVNKALDDFISYMMTTATFRDEAVLLGPRIKAMLEAKMILFNFSENPQLTDEQKVMLKAARRKVFHDVVVKYNVKGTAIK